MAISFVDSATGVSAGNGGDPTIDLTTITGLAEDDLVIVTYSMGTQAGDYDMAMLSAGWTQISDIFSDDTGDTNLGVFRKFMGASPDTSAQVDGNGNASTAVAATAMAFRGVDLTTPLDVAAVEATGINTMHPDPGSIDFTTAGSAVVICVGNGHQQFASAGYTFPTGYTTNAVNTGGDDTIDTTVGMGYNLSPSDPEDPGALTHGGTDSANYSWCAVTLALRPASGGASNITMSVGNVLIGF